MEGSPSLLTLVSWLVDGLGLSSTFPLEVVTTLTPLVFWELGLGWGWDGNLPCYCIANELVNLVSWLLNSLCPSTIFLLILHCSSIKELRASSKENSGGALDGSAW